MDPARDQQAKRIGEAIAACRSFLICGHERPDGDCLGSQLALAHALTGLGKRAHCHTSGPIADYYRFLPGIAAMSEGPRMPAAITAETEATFLLDCSAPDRVFRGFQTCGQTICMDHHETNDWRGDLNLIDPRASSTGEIVFDVFERLGFAITPDIATCLYTAILTDTGSFRYANTNARSLAICARLIECGAEPSRIATACYETREPQSIMLAGAVLARLRFECGGALAWGEITNEMFRQAGGAQNDPEGLVSDMRAARGVRVSLLFKQTDTGLRVSLRGRDGARVDKIAERFGGGGHRGAAGAELRGDYEPLRERVLTAVRQALKGE